AHEPLWDAPRHLQRLILDRRLSQGVIGQSYVRKRLQEGRNVYRDLVAFAERLGVPVTLDISNELVQQIHRHLPGTLEELCRAYSQRLIRPVYLPAHHTPPSLLTAEELVDELRLNQECVHELLGAPPPVRRGCFFTECSIDRRLIPAVEELGMDYT